MQTSEEHDSDPSGKKELRLWPGVAAISVQWLCWVVAPLAAPGPATGFISVGGGLAGGLAVAVWWAFLSRAPRPERFGFIALAAVTLFVASRLVDESIAEGMMGMLMFLYAVPVASLAIVASAAGTRRLTAGTRRTAMTVAILLSCGVWTLLRSEGITGSGSAEFRWRWAKTAEQQFLETIPLTIDGEAQVLLLSGSGLTSVAPRDGRVLWEHAWPGGDRIVQPAAVREGGLLVAEGSGFGLRHIAVKEDAEKWSVAERWESTRLKPYFNDFVVHERYAFGFDGSILACIDIEDGSRKWKGGRYGHGQLLLLADQDLLLVLSERGELVTVAATPDRFEEVARHSGIEGKTWNHPALAGDILLVRNGEEAAAFRLALEAE